MQQRLDLLEIEKQDLLTDHVKSFAIKEREWRSRLDEQMGHREELQLKIETAVLAKEREMSAIVTRLGHEHAELNAQHQKATIEARKLHEEQLEALHDKVKELRKVDGKALAEKTRELKANIAQLELDKQDMKARYEEDRARLLRVSEMELRAVNERLETDKLTSPSR